MRGGRFQQKTSEDASIRNAEALFETRSVVEIREVEARTRKDIEEKKEELRQLVGASYRDLIESADSILLMRQSCEAVAENIQKMEQGFCFLEKTITSSTTSSNSDQERKRREKLYWIGSRVKYLVDTPEKIWGCLDEHMYLEAAERYLRAREVHSLLTGTTEKEEKRELLANFPLLRHQWPLVENFRDQIAQKSKDRLQESGLKVDQYAIALAGVAIIDELHSSQIFNLFLETRKVWLRAQIRAASTARERVVRETGSKLAEQKGADREAVATDTVHNRGKNEKRKSKGTVQVERQENGFLKDVRTDVFTVADSIAAVLCRLVHMIQCSLCHVGELLLEVSGKMPLLYSTVLTAPPGSQLFGGIPNPEKEVRLWKAHRETLETSMVPLGGKQITEVCISWLRTCAREIASEGKLLLQQLRSGRELARVEQIVKESMGKQEALNESLDWLKSAFGRTIDSPWDSLCELLLKEPTSLWDIIFENMFVSRMKEVIDSGLGKISIEDLLDDTLSAPSLEEQENNVRVRELDSSLGSSNLGKSMGMEGSRLAWKVWGEDKENLSSTDSFFDGEVVRVKDRVDDGLKYVMEDLVCFLQGSQMHARTEELAPFLQEQCKTCMLGIIEAVSKRLLVLSDSMSKLSESWRQCADVLRLSLENHGELPVRDGRPTDFRHIDYLDQQVVVEKALFLGRLSVALGQHSSSIHIIFGDPGQWVAQENLTASYKVQAAGRKNLFLERDNSLFLNSERWVPKRGNIGTHGAKERSPKLQELQLKLRQESVSAHRIWVVWSTEKLTASFLRDLQKDDCLSTSTALKGWEETVLRQEEENGGEVELKMALPAVPSPYAVTFLYAGSQEIYRVGGHILDRAVLRYFSWRLREKVLSAYESFILDPSSMSGRVSEKGLLQLLFDLRFLTDVLSGGEDVGVNYLDSENSVWETNILKNNNSDAAAQGQKNRTTSLLFNLYSKLDPIDWAIYEPHLWENERRYYQRCAVLFGLLIQLNRLYTDTIHWGSKQGDANTLNMSRTVPRFTYLPMSTPIFSVPGGSVSRMQGNSSGDDSSRGWNPYGNGGDGYKYSSPDNATLYSVVGARPLLKSIMGQVGSKFGEGLKLGLLSDGQVERFKDKSAAAISTFGDMLPVQAAGLFSSLTAGATKTET